MIENTTTSVAFGRMARTMTPSGRIFIIREQNGNDDDILSNPERMRDLSNIDDFLHAICIKEIISEKEVPVTFESIVNMAQKDRFHLLIFSRVHSLGKDIKFNYHWDDEDTPTTYIDDLSQYLHDYSKPFPEAGEEGYFKYRIPPYPEKITEPFSLTTKSGKHFRFNVMTRQGEKMLLNLGPNQVTKNAELKARNLEYKSETGEWITVENFFMFSKMDMIEIHKAVLEVDPNYNLLTELEHPKDKERKILFPIMSSADFFFPVEI